MVADGVAQVVSTVLANLTRSFANDLDLGLNLTSKGKVRNSWSRGDSGLPVGAR